jgi:hypothetical protein
MTDLEQEAAWRAEFEADGERAVLDTICHGPGIYPDPKRSFALRWLGEREVERARQEQKIAPTSAAHFGQRLPQWPQGLLLYWSLGLLARRGRASFSNLMTFWREAKSKSHSSDVSIGGTRR